MSCSRKLCKFNSTATTPTCIKHMFENMYRNRLRIARQTGDTKTATMLRKERNAAYERELAISEQSSHPSVLSQPSSQTARARTVARQSLEMSQTQTATDSKIVKAIQRRIETMPDGKRVTIETEKSCQVSHTDSMEVKMRWEQSVEKFTISYKELDRKFTGNVAQQYFQDEVKWRKKIFETLPSVGMYAYFDIPLHEAWPQMHKQLKAAVQKAESTASLDSINILELRRHSYPRLFYHLKKRLNILAKAVPHLEMLTKQFLKIMSKAVQAMMANVCETDQLNLGRFSIKVQKLCRDQKLDLEAYALEFRAKLHEVVQALTTGPALTAKGMRTSVVRILAEKFGMVSADEIRHVRALLRTKANMEPSVNTLRSHPYLLGWLPSQIELLGAAPSFRIRQLHRTLLDLETKHCPLLRGMFSTMHTIGRVVQNDMKPTTDMKAWDVISVGPFERSCPPSGTAWCQGLGDTDHKLFSWRERNCVRDYPVCVSGLWVQCVVDVTLDDPIFLELPAVYFAQLFSSVAPRMTTALKRQIPNFLEADMKSNGYEETVQIELDGVGKNVPMRLLQHKAFEWHLQNYHHNQKQLRAASHEEFASNKKFI